MSEQSPDPLLVHLVGDGMTVPCVDGVDRPYVNLDAAASTSALPVVADRVQEFLPWYSSVHRGAGYKSRHATEALNHPRPVDGRSGRLEPEDVMRHDRPTMPGAVEHSRHRYESTSAPRWRHRSHPPGSGRRSGGLVCRRVNERGFSRRRR